MNPADIRNARGQLRLTQAAFAEKLGVSRVFLGLMERGRVPISRTTALAIHALAPRTSGAEFQPEPIRRILENALVHSLVVFERNVDREGVLCDYYLPDYELVIQVDQEKRSRTIKTLEVLQNVIVLQGKSASVLFSKIAQNEPIGDATNVDDELYRAR